MPIVARGGGRWRVGFYQSLISALVVCVLSTPRYDRCNPQEREPVPNVQEAGWEGSRACLEGFCMPPPAFENDRSSEQ